MPSAVTKFLFETDLHEDVQAVDITTIDPLNLALSAKNIWSRIWWWFVTVASTISLVALIAGLINNYANSPTAVAIRVCLLFFLAGVIDFLQ
jgi:hypothetical protein